MSERNFLSELVEYYFVSCPVKRSIQYCAVGDGTMARRTAVAGRGGPLEQGKLGRPFASWFLISPDEALFRRRGFPETPATARLENAGGAFVAGHNIAALSQSTDEILYALAARPSAECGFFAEGAAMGASIRTICRPWRDTLSPLLAALRTHYVHLSHVGVGWAMARLPFAKRALARWLDPMLAPLATDGIGFHDGYFRSKAVAGGWRRLHGALGSVYDQGVGRSLWFSCGADPARIRAVVAGLETARRDDLWAGVGLASVYAGGASSSDIERLKVAAGPCERWLMQGAAFAVGAHARTGIVPEEAEVAALQISGADPETLVALVERALADARRHAGAQPAPYQCWRNKVADALEQRDRR